jgi:hypothetical protein
MLATDVTIDCLNALLRGELAAVETYRQALARMADQPGARDLRRIEMEHREATLLLEEQVWSHGSRPEQSSGVWGTFASAWVGGAKLFGNLSTLSALKEGEELGLGAYQQAVQNLGLPVETQKLIHSLLLPQTHEHIRALERAIARQQRPE